MSRKMLQICWVFKNRTRTGCSIEKRPAEEDVEDDEEREDEEDGDVELMLGMNPNPPYILARSDSSAR
jgi:hypothetical protein